MITNFHHPGPDPLVILSDREERLKAIGSIGGASALDTGTTRIVCLVAHGRHIVVGRTLIVGTGRPRYGASTMQTACFAHLSRCLGRRRMRTCTPSQGTFLDKGFLQTDGGSLHILLLRRRCFGAPPGREVLQDVARGDLKAILSSVLVDSSKGERLEVVVVLSRRCARHWMAVCVRVCVRVVGRRQGASRHALCFAFGLYGCLLLVVSRRL
jgi:hypothetical protein